MPKTLNGSEVWGYDLKFYENTNIDQCETNCKNDLNCVWITSRNNKDCWLHWAHKDEKGVYLGLKNETPLYYKQATNIWTFDVGNTPGNNIIDCHEKCKNEPNCEFYAFVEGEKRCALKYGKHHDFTTRFVWRNDSEIFDCQQDVDIKARPDICATPICTKDDGSGLNRQVCKDWCRTSGGKCDNAAKAYCSANPNDKDFCGCYNFSRVPKDPALKDLKIADYPWCYAPECANSQTAYKPYNYITPGLCPSQQITVCSADFNQTAGAAASMKGITVVQNCSSTGTT